MALPWAPLLTVTRSGLAEVTMYGIIAVVDGSGRPLLSVGDQSAVLWTRSVLKPWQLLNHLHILKNKYPALKDEHYALMISSHNAEEIHEKALDEILKIGGIDENALQNTPLYPYSAKHRVPIKERGEKPKARWASCSGKHAGFVMASNAVGDDPSQYLKKDAAHFVRMKRLLAYFLQKDWAEIPETTDGCRLPNYGFTAGEIADLYRQLWLPQAELHLPPADSQLAPILENFSNLSHFMSDYPQYIGGSERLDTNLMQGKYSDLSKAKIIAKEGADGLLSVGVSPCKNYPLGVGILIKSSSGDNPRYVSRIVTEIFTQMGLQNSAPQEKLLDHLKINFNFGLGKAVKR